MSPPFEVRQEERCLLNATEVSFSRVQNPLTRKKRGKNARGIPGRDHFS